MSDQVTDHIVRDEGAAYTDDPADAGGPTKFGITLATLSAYRGAPCTAADVAALSRDEAVAIYRANYVAGPGFSHITSDSLRTAVADAAVLFGPKRVTRALQQLVGVTPDGVFGPLSIAAVNAKEPRLLINQLSLWRIREHIVTVADNPAQAKFLRGWFERAASFVT